MRGIRSMVPGVLLVLSWLHFGVSARAGDRQAKIYVDAPGVYEIAVTEVADALGGEAGRGLGDLSLSHRGDPLPLWPLEDRGRLRFLVPAERFDRSRRLDGSPMIVLLLTETEQEPAATGSVVQTQGELPEQLARAKRVRRFERDLSRAPLDTAAVEAGVDSTWYWTMISHQASSKLEIELGDLGDRVSADDLGMDDLGMDDLGMDDFGMTVTVDLLGWSDPRLPEGVPHHRVDVRLNGETIGAVEWNGRRRHVAELAVPSTVGLEPEDNRLTLKIPTRREGSAEDAREIVDLVYVDRVEVRYRADRRLASAEAPLRLAPADHPRRLPAPDASADAVALSSTGERLDRAPDGGWIVPASPSADAADIELWVVEPSHMRAPLAVEPTTSGAFDLPSELDYVVIAPRDLVPATERLADFHRRRGLRTAVVDVVAIYDGFGHGEKSPQAVRRFLDHQLRTSPDLRYVLLVGDADWLISEDTTPYLDPRPQRRDRVPTFVRASAYGPAASDHFYAADPEDEAIPRFAVGRLPVAGGDELEAVVDKLIRHATTPKPEGAETLLMLSDHSTPSLRRREKLSERIEGAGFTLRRPDERAEVARDEAVIEALDQGPSMVYFGGHGSRFQWQLGEAQLSGPETYFDREDVARLAPARRGPVVVSISCATAPFDHPSADSLGEVMVLAPDRGAVAFLGAGVRLFTPRHFSEGLIAALARESTVGDAVVAAKRDAAQPHVSYLYNLLGDPALPLR